MAQVTDLTFQELNDAAIANQNIGVPIFSISDDTIMLDIKKLTGDSFTALSDAGFLKLMYKMVNLAIEAQKTVNSAIVDEEDEEETSPLDCFKQDSFSPIHPDGYVTVTQHQKFKIPITVNTVIGI
jgi:hypothetical protein